MPYLIIFVAPCMQFIGLECYDNFLGNFMIIFEKIRSYFIHVYFSFYPVLIEVFFFVCKIKILVTFIYWYPIWQFLIKTLWNKKCICLKIRCFILLSAKILMTSQCWVPCWQERLRIKVSDISWHRVLKRNFGWLLIERQDKRH